MVVGGIVLITGARVVVTIARVVVTPITSLIKKGLCRGSIGAGYILTTGALGGCVPGAGGCVPGAGVGGGSVPSIVLVLVYVGGLLVVCVQGGGGVV